MRRTWTWRAAGLIGALAVALAVGAGSAAAAPTVGSPAAPARPAYCLTLPVLQMTTLQQQACGLLGGVSSATQSVTQAVPQVVPRVVRQVPQVVPQVVPRVVQQVPQVVRQPVRTVPRAASTATGSSPSSRSGATAGAPSAAATTVAPAAPAYPVAATRDYASMFSSAYDPVPASLLGLRTGVPGGAGGSGALLSPVALGAGSLLTGPRAGLVPLGTGDRVTTSSTATPTAGPAAGGIGTPALLAVLTAASVLALVVRSAVLRRTRRGPAAPAPA